MDPLQNLTGKLEARYRSFFYMVIRGWAIFSDGNYIIYIFNILVGFNVAFGCLHQQSNPVRSVGYIFVNRKSISKPGQ